MDDDKKSNIISALIYLAFIAALLIGFVLSQVQARREFENGTAYGRELGYDEGYEEGYSSGYDDGMYTNITYPDGYSDGYKN